MEIVRLNETICANLSLDNPDSMITNHIEARVILAAVFSLVAAATVLGNVTVIAALVRFKCFQYTAHDARNKTQLLMISMAVSDAVLGGTIMPFGIYNVIKNRQWELGSSLCNVREVSDIILSAVSFLHVACMALDRYLAVCRPLLFRTLTTKATLLMIGVCWILPSAFVLTIVLSGWHIIGIEHIVYCYNFQKICIFNHNNHSLLVIILVLLDFPLIVTFVLYFLVLREVKKYHKRTPVVYSCQEKPALQIELHNREKICTKRATVSCLPKKSRNNEVEMASVDDNSVSFKYRLLHRLCSRINKRKTESSKCSYSEHQNGQHMSCKPCDIELMRVGRLDEDMNTRTKQPEFINEQIVLQESNTELSEESRCTHQSRCGNDSTDSGNSTHRKTWPIKMAAGRPRSNTKAVTTIGLIVACFTVCWLPLNISVLVSIFKNYTNPSMSFIVLWLAYTNSLINPIIYCYQRSTRRAVWSVVCPSRYALTR